MKTIKEQIAVMQAYADGKEIEALCYSSEWEPINNPIWNWADYTYRIKPEPKWYENITIPVLCWVSDDNEIPDYNDQVKIVVEYLHKRTSCQFGFHDSNGLCYKYATPLTDEELEEFGLQKIQKDK